MNTRSDRTEFAPRSVDNAVSPAEIQKQRVEREITLEIADVARKFNKVLGKISRKGAIEIVDDIDYKHALSYETVKLIVNEFFAENPEHFYRTDGIVARLQIELASRGHKITTW